MAHPLSVAIANDDCSDLKQELENYLRQEGTLRWEQNPLYIAIQKNSVNCAKAIVQLRPDLLSWTNQDDYSVMHFICETGNVAIVKAIVEVAPELSLLADKELRNPLHIAAIKGREEVVRILVDACPESLEEVTSLKETPLHLAVKNNQFGCFKVLVNKLLELKQEWDINKKDREGNTVLHLATSRKQIQVLNLLLSHNSEIAPVVQVHSENKRGLTALDLHYQLSSQDRNSNDKEIRNILHHAVARERSELDSPTKQMMRESISSLIKSVLVTVFLFVAGAAYASLFNLNNIYPTLEHHVDDDFMAAFHLKDMVTIPNPLPAAFYFLVFNMVTFTGSMVVILVNTWSLVSKSSFCYRAVPVFVMGAMFLTYALVLKKIVPKFSVTIGSLKIPSFWVLILLYGLPLIFSLVAMWFIAKGLKTRHVNKNLEIGPNPKWSSCSLYISFSQAVS